ncbi:MAG: MarR family transcriptional regulator [Chloroflexi bacterium]|nr:MarR family transcriptional regulator [Chloroflexota bacterium]
MLVMVAPEALPAEEVLERWRQVVTYAQGSRPGWLDLDLTVAQIKGLFVLAKHGPLTISRVAELLHVGNPRASMLVEQLVESGLVERAEDAADRRRSLARLTPRGEATVSRLHEGGRERLREWLGRLPAEELAALALGLDGLLAVAAADRR